MENQNLTNEDTGEMISVRLCIVSTAGGWSDENEEDWVDVEIPAYLEGASLEDIHDYLIDYEEVYSDYIEALEYAVQSRKDRVYAALGNVELL